MRAIVIDGPGRIGARDVEWTAVPGECTVRVLTAGICGTDLQLLQGYAEFAGIPGHEFVGVVHAVSHASDVEWLGKRVVGEINVGCQQCPTCREGVKEHCPDRTVVGIRGRSGAFAEYLSLPSANLHAVPGHVDDESAVFAEPVAAACRVLEQVAVTPSWRVGILGDGRMGLIAAQVMRTATDDVTVIGRHQHKLDVARGLGLAAARADAVRKGFDLIVDLTGRPEGLEQAVALVKPRGTVVLKTTAHDGAFFHSWPVVVHEVTLVGSRCGPFGPALSMLASGAVRVRPLIARVARLEDHAAAFDTARTALKVLFAIGT